MADAETVNAERIVHPVVVRCKGVWDINVARNNNFYHFKSRVDTTAFVDSGEQNGKRAVARKDMLRTAGGVESAITKIPRIIRRVSCQVFEIEREQIIRTIQ